MKFLFKRDPETKALPFIGMAILAVVAGTVGGLGAVIFQGLFALIRNLSFSGQWHLFINLKEQLPPSIWGWGLIFVPAIGAVIVTGIINNFGAEVKGSGVPEVLYAIYYRKGFIRPAVALWRVLATAVSAGTGASVGRDGPMIQLGSALGSTIGQIIRMPTWQRDLLIAAASGASLATIFKAPVGALMFTLELMVVSINPKSITIVAIATLIGTYLGQLVFGAEPLLYVHAIQLYIPEAVSLYEFLFFIPLGIIIGLASVLLIHSIFFVNDKLEQYFKSPYTQHCIAMFGVGLLLYAFMYFTGYYYIEGVNNASIFQILTDILKHPLLLAFLFLGKFAVTSLSLGSGASGGIFSPSLFLGATLGGLTGVILEHIFPGNGFDPSMYAIAGMAGSVGSITGAAITGIVLVFEQTRDYHAVLPAVLTLALANGTRAYFTAETMYTMSIARRGHFLPKGLMSQLISTYVAQDIMTRDFQIIPQSQLSDTAIDPHTRYILIEHNGEILGFFPKRWFTLELYHQLSSRLSPHLAWVSQDTSLSSLVQTIRKHATELILVTETGNTIAPQTIIGVISKNELIKVMQKTVQLLEE